MSFNKLIGEQGGTGIDSAVGGDVGKFLKLTSNSPMAYAFDTPTGVPGAPDTSVQFNNGGVLGGTDLLYNQTSTFYGLGTPVGTDTKFSIGQTFTNDTDVNGFFKLFYHNPGVDGTSIIGDVAVAASLDTNIKNFGTIAGTNYSAGHFGSGTVDNIVAGSFSALQASGGLATNIYGGVFSTDVLSSGGAVNAYGIKVASPTIVGGTVTNLYGLAIDPQTGGSTNYAIYYNNGSDGLYLTGDGKLGVGINPAHKFDLLGSANITQDARTSGSPTGFSYTAGAHTTLAAATPFTDVSFDLSRTVQFATGAINAFQVGMNIDVGATYSFVGASNLAAAIGLRLEGLPQAGTNTTITNGLAQVYFSGTQAAGRNATSSGLNSTILIDSPGIASSVGAVSKLSAWYVFDSSYILGNQTATLTDWHIGYIGQQTVTSLAGTRTVTNASGLKVYAPIAGDASVVFTNGAFAAHFVGSVKIDSSTTPINIIQSAASSGSPTGFTYTSGLHTGLSNTDYTAVLFDLSDNILLTGGGAGGETFIGMNLDVGYGISALAAETNVVGIGVRIGTSPYASTNVTMAAQVALFVGGSTGYATSLNSQLIINPLGLFDGIGAVDTVSLLLVLAETVNLGNQTATLTNLNELRLGAITYTSSTNVRTVTNPATIYAEAPIASTNVTFTNPALAGHFVGATKLEGSTIHAYVAKTANYTLTANDYLIECTTNSFDITLPTAVGITGTIYKIKNSGSGKTITMKTTGGQTIDGSASGVLTLAYRDCMEVMSNGSNYIIC